eukprot:scaffold22773_cov35-Cyclotella_meneghiniana.AAC.8
MRNSPTYIAISLTIEPLRMPVGYLYPHQIQLPPSTLAQHLDSQWTTTPCANCQSQNIRGRDLQTTTNIADACFCFESLCIRAQLDLFWVRSKTTVANHVSEARFMCRYGKALGFTPMPPLGPFKLKQHNGMLLQAILLKMRTMEKGPSKNPDGHSLGY